LARNFTKN
jgi:hypothetical protein